MLYITWSFNCYSASFYDTSLKRLTLDNFNVIKLNKWVLYQMNLKCCKIFASCIADMVLCDDYMTLCYDTSREINTDMQLITLVWKSFCEVERVISYWVALKYLVNFFVWMTHICVMWQILGIIQHGTFQNQNPEHLNSHCSCRLWRLNRPNRMPRYIVLELIFREQAALLLLASDTLLWSQVETIRSNTEVFILFTICSSVLIFTTHNACCLIVFLLVTKL